MQSVYVSSTILTLILFLGITAGIVGGRWTADRLLWSPANTVKAFTDNASTSLTKATSTPPNVRIRATIKSINSDGTIVLRTQTPYPDDSALLLKVALNTQTSIENFRGPRINAEDLRVGDSYVLSLARETGILRVRSMIFYDSL